MTPEERQAGYTKVAEFTIRAGVDSFMPSPLLHYDAFDVYTKPEGTTLVFYVNEAPILAPAYYEGVRDGIRAHAIWHNGRLVVGALDKPIEVVFAEVDQYEAEQKRWDFG